MPAVEPVYGLTEGLYPRTVAEGRAGRRWRACRTCPNGSTRPSRVARRPQLRRRAERAAQPQTPGDVEPTEPRCARLAYDELLANQLALMMVRARMRVLAGRRRSATGGSRESLAALPYRADRRAGARASPKSAPISARPNA